MASCHIHAALIGGAAVSAAPTKQSTTNQAINQPTTLSTTLSTNQAINQPTNHLILPIKSSYISNKNTNFANP
jgi:hypothetical protein